MQLDNSNPKEKKEVIDEFYGNMHLAHEKAKKINQKSIFLIGQIRSGKSTTMNLIKDPQSLIGDGNEPKLFYSIRDLNDNTLAAISNSYSSVTLIQNILNIRENGEEITLIDLPGFKENRTEIQILLCSFIMKSCFTLSKQVKFILVIGNYGFLDTSGLQFITTIKNFVRFFKYTQMSPQEKMKLFSSVSILITAVKYSEQQRAVNKYLEILSENLSHLKKMSQTNSQISEIIDFAEQMLTNIIKDKRIQLFKEATVGESPQQSRIIENLNLLNWKYFDLSAIRDNYLSFPFAQAFSSMNNSQKDNVVDLVICKLKQFKQLQKYFVKIIDSYLDDPFDTNLNLSDVYEELKLFISNNLHHEDARNRFQGIPQQQEYSQLNPMIILNNLKQIFKIGYIQVEDQEQKKDYQHYCDEIISKIFQPTMVIMSESFALNERQKCIFELILDIFTQFIIFFKILCQVDRQRIDSKRLQYKDAMIIANNLFIINQQQLINRFLVSISSSFIQQFTSEQLIYFSNLVKEHVNQPEISKICYESLSRMMFQIGQNETKKEKYREGLENYMESLYSLLKHIHLQNIKNPNLSNHVKWSEHISYAEKILEKMYRTYLITSKKQFRIQRIFMELQVPFSQIHKLFLKFNHVQIMKKYQNNIIENENTENFDIIFYSYKLALLYEELEDFNNAIQKLKTLLIFRQVQRNLAVCKKIKDKISHCQSKMITLSQSSYSIFSNDKQIIYFINEFNNRVVKSDRTYSIQQLQKLSERVRQNQQSIQKKDQFDIDLPEKITFFTILKFTEYLIDKIGNRKVTFLIGESCGKTTTFCYLKQKALVGSKSNQSYRLQDTNQQKNIINYNGQTPTQFPNFGLYKQDEILIDLPVLNSSNIFIRILYRHLLTQMIQKSKAFRFLIIVNQNDIKDCREINLNIEFLLSLFNEPQFILTKIAVLFTHSEHQNITQTKSKLEKAINLLARKKEIYSIQLKLEKVKQYQMLVTIMQEIHDKIKFAYIMKPTNDIKISQDQNDKILQRLSQRDFNFQQTKQLMDSRHQFSRGILLPKQRSEQQEWCIAVINRNMQYLRNKIKKIVQFDINLQKNIERNDFEIPMIEFSLEEKQEFLGVTKQSFNKQFPFLFNTLFQQLPFKEQKEMVNLILHILTLNKNQYFLYTSSGLQYEQIVPQIYRYLKFIRKISFLNPENRLLFQGLLIKIYQKLQQWQILWEKQFYRPYLSYIRYFQHDIINRNQQIAALSLVSFFCQKFDVEKFIFESQQGMQENFNHLFNLFDQFLTEQISQKFRQKLQMVMQNLIKHEKVKGKYISIKLLLFQIQNYSKFIEQDLFTKNSKLIDLIKQICQMLITFDLTLADEICKKCQNIELQISFYDKLYQTIPDKSILGNIIDYLMRERYFQKAMEKCNAYIKLQNDATQKEKYNQIKLLARINIQQGRQITQAQKLNSIESFDIQSFLSFRQRIRSINHL